jgi:hypothetical protein
LLLFIIKGLGKFSFVKRNLRELGRKSGKEEPKEEGENVQKTG